MTEVSSPGRLAGRHKLPPGMIGSATISDCGRYRHELMRQWAVGESVPYALWIGMNPSSADGESNDRTVDREIGFSKREGFGRCSKVNVMDYRATYPADLTLTGVVPCSPTNRPTIARLAAGAGLVVAAWGALDKAFRAYAVEIERLLLAQGVTLHCVGKAKDESPRHPLYVKGDAPLIIYRKPT